MHFSQFLTTLLLIYIGYYAIVILLELAGNGRKGTISGNGPQLVSYELKQQVIKPQPVVNEILKPADEKRQSPVSNDGNSQHHPAPASIPAEEPHEYDLLTDLGLETISGDGIELTAESLSALLFDNQ